MSFGVERLHHSVVRPFVRYVECSKDGATVRVLTTIEDFGVQLVVQIVDCVIESNQHDLGCFLGRYATWYVRSSAATVRQDAIAAVALVGYG